MLTKEELKEIVDIGVAISSEKDENCLFDEILDTTIRIANCDAGTLYLINEGVLSFKIMKIKSLDLSVGGKGEKRNLPSFSLDEKNVCVYAVENRALINIANTKEDSRFEFMETSYPRGLINYEVHSMLVLPLINYAEEVVGVLQLINAFDDKNNVISFSEDGEYTIKTLGSLAASAISNIKYVNEIKNQMESFVDAFTMAIDERTPYNGMHSKKVRTYVELIANHINELHEKGECADFFSKEDKEQLILAASLHDIGKMVVPLSVMNKSTRLEGYIREIKSRFKLLMAYYEIDMLRGQISKEQYEKEILYIKDSFEKIRFLNSCPYIDDSNFEFVKELANKRYEGSDGRILEYITSYEQDCLLIRKGTLTDSERMIMNNHVVMTKRILDKVHFGERYSRVREIAENHHELLDGSGYPGHKKGDELCLETRILTVVDIFDALTSLDRPYKSPVEREEAFMILRKMAKEDKIEGRLVEYLYDVIND